MILDGPAFKKLDRAKSTTFVVTDDIAVVPTSIVPALKEAALRDPLKRARVCLHRSTADPLHQMIIAHHRDTYTRPHRHRNKAESFNMIEGRLMVVFFDDAGTVTRHLTLGTPGSAEPSIYRLSPGTWHTVLPLTEYVVFHEITSGPFVQGESEVASWAPDESDAAGTARFKADLMKKVLTPT